MEIIRLSPDDLIAYEGNARSHPPGQVKRIGKSIEAFGFNQPILLDTNKVIIAGHARLLAARAIGMDEVPCIILGDLNDDEVRAYRLADNALAEHGSWSEKLLTAELQKIKDSSVALELTGLTGEKILEAITDDPLDDAVTPRRETLREAFGVPPFTVLDAIQGEWRKRKIEWVERLDLHHYQEPGKFGREQIGPKTAFQDMGKLSYAEEWEKYLAATGKTKKELPLPKYFQEMVTNINARTEQGVSNFDPVLMETLVRWFCPVGGQVVDLFAGGVEHGAVAAALGRPYLGIELRQESGYRATAAMTWLASWTVSRLTWCSRRPRTTRSRYTATCQKT